MLQDCSWYSLSHSTFMLQPLAFHPAQSICLIQNWKTSHVTASSLASIRLHPNHTWWMFLQLSMDLLKGNVSTHVAPLIPLWVKLTADAVSISREDWEDHVGSPQNCLLAKPFCSWLCSLVFLLGIVLIVNGILSEKLVEAQPRGWSMHSNSQRTVTATVTRRTCVVKVVCNFASQVQVPSP